VCRGSGRQWVGGQIPRFTVDVARIDADAGSDQEHHKCPMYLSSLDDGVRGIYSERCSGDMRFMIVLGKAPQSQLIENSAHLIGQLCLMSNGINMYLNGLIGHIMNLLE
jgi:hypothetical protein